MYSYSDDHPLFLKDIIRYIKEGKIKLLITQQLVDEFYRNREGKLAPSLKTIEELKKIKFRVPAFCANVRLIKSIRTKYNSIRELSTKAYEKLVRDSLNERLEVDKLFKKIFKKSETIPISKTVLAKAKERFDIGNPPGKDSSYGDAIDWEILLEKVPEKEDLYFITVDGDFLSKISDDEFSNFLRWEWKKKKSSEIKLYKSISRFLKDEFEDKKITKEQIKEEEKPGGIISSIEFNKGWAPWKGALFGNEGEGVVHPFGTQSGSAFLSGSNFSSLSENDPNSIFISPKEKEERCPSCNKVFYIDSMTTKRECPHCGYFPAMDY